MSSDSTLIPQIIQVVASRGLVFSKNSNKLLLVAEKNLHWHTPGGWVDKLEPATLACQREVKEETGIDITVDKVVFILEIIEDSIERFGNLVHKFDLFCVCYCESDEIDEEWEDRDNNLIVNRKFIDESEWLQNKDIMVPKQLSSLKFAEIQSMPSCYSWLPAINKEYKRIINGI